MAFVHRQPWRLCLIRREPAELLEEARRSSRGPWGAGEFNREGRGRGQAGNTATKEWSFNALAQPGDFTRIIVLVLVLVAIVAGAGWWFMKNKKPGPQARKQLRFTDATTIALVQRRGIDRVLSFDHDFDGIVRGSTRGRRRESPGAPRQLPGRRRPRGLRRGCVASQHAA